MPSAFDAEFLTTAAPDMLTQFGETVTLIAADRRESDLTAVVARDPVPLEDNRSNKRRMERCVVWALAATGECGDLTAFEHDDGPIPLETTLALRLEGDGRRLWDFKEQVGLSGGMLGARFERVNIDETGDLTPGIGR
jgi:hypothetical protein